MPIFTKSGRTTAFSLGLVVVMVLAASTLPWTNTPEPVRAAVDVQVSNEQFRRYINEWSEPEGYFDSDNFITNETSYLHVVGELRQRVRPGGIYLGVGPDQNFSYLVQTRPALAIIPDIRRQNMLQHLLYKALFAMAANRKEYLALLFSKEIPAVKSEGSFAQLLTTMRTSRSSPELFQKNIAAIKNLLLQRYSLKLTSDDLLKIEYVYRTFWMENLDLRFSSIGRSNSLSYPTFEDILLETDRQGQQQNYLSTEEGFQWLKKFQGDNRVIPIVGDFAGPHTLNTVGRFLKQNGLQVSTFYTSNVEFYLFGRPEWTRYIGNLQGLPLAADAVFIRSYFPTYGRPHPLNIPGHRSTSLVLPVARLLKEYDEGRVASYWDVVKP